MRMPAALLLMVSIAAAAQAPDEAGDGADKLQAFLAQCRARYAEVDARIDASGRRDAGYFRVPGFPYLRSDRLMASFGPELGNPDAFDDWTLQLRDNDAYSREVEFSNMGLSTAERAQLLVDLRLCAVWLTNTELADAATLKKLQAAMQLPRAAAHASAHEDAAWRRRVRDDFSAAPLDLVHDQLWLPAPLPDPREVPRSFDHALHDHLGRAGLLMGEWPVLAARYAPALSIETRGEFDRPGTPRWQAGALSIDAQQPAVYYLPSYARVQGRMLVQISYFIWFAGRGAGDVRTDGLIWRVTLDEDGEPVMADSVHTGGGDQLWFPLAGWLVRADARDGALVPQAQVPREHAVHLRSGAHAVTRLLARADEAAAQRYTLHPYEDLLTLPLPGGGTRSLYDAQGRVAGSSDLYQWSWQTTSPRATRYFDDPDLLESLFVPLPRSAVSTAAQR
ncbi:MAG TPA: hypothetical protein VHE37_13315 [Nevskiaceae bacterium]|nr:hypothetical protein [Nevskiaceae bacterium]